MDHVQVDFTKYPEGIEEIIRHMDFMEDDYAARKLVIDVMVMAGLFY